MAFKKNSFVQLQSARKCALEHEFINLQTAELVQSAARFSIEMCNMPGDKNLASFPARESLTDNGLRTC